MNRNKKAISLMISYVLLTIIALVMAVSVWAWMKYYIPDSEVEECNPDISLFVQSYSCDIVKNEISLNITNKGFFRVEGFYIRATNESNDNKQPIYPLNISNPAPWEIQIEGRYYFQNPQLPQQTNNTHFDYTHMNTIRKLQIQPFVSSEDGSSIVLCENIFNLKIPAGECA